MGGGSAGGKPAKKKQRRSTPTKPRVGTGEGSSDGAGTRRLTIKEGEAAVVSGNARLSVVSGEAWIAGRRLAAGSEAVEIRAGRGMEHGVVIDGIGAAVAKVPCTPPSTATVVLLEPLGSLASSQDGEQEESFSFLEGKKQLGNLGGSGGGSAPCSFPESWRAAADEVATGAAADRRRSKGAMPVVATVGPKGAGKSTFSRLLVNSLLNHCPAVAFVDTDAGQPEFSPPGLLSVSIIRGSELLAGPPHEHQRSSWEHAHFTGAISPSADPDAYVAAVTELLRWVAGPQGPRGRMPVVLNTHGWVKGLGLDILATILQAAEPSHVVQLDQGAPGAAKDFPPGDWWSAEPNPAAHQAAATPRHIILPAAKTFAPADTGSGGNAAHGRTLRWIAWAKLSCRKDGDQPSLPRSSLRSSNGAEEAANLLAETPPYVVPADALPIRFLHTQPPPGEELRAANGAIVGLMTAQPSGGAVRCVGMGLVRGVDVKASDGPKLHILTPTPPDVLPAVTELVAGSLEIPPQLLHSSTYVSPYISLFCLASEGTAAGRQHARNTLTRRAHA